MCWFSWNTNWTVSPIFVVAWLILILKHPSADVNPAAHSLLEIFLFVTAGLITATTSGKANFNSGERPRLIEALIATILRKPAPRGGLLNVLSAQ